MTAMNQKQYFLFFSCFSLFCLLLVSCQDIVFPNEKDKSFISSSKSITDYVPISVPDQCPENMFIFPGSGKKPLWICDCRPGYLYFPMNDSCHEAYRQGPCPSGNYVVLLEGEVVPKCVVNPCNIDGQVPYNDSCYSLRNINGPCEPDYILSVNEETFQLECTYVDVVPFIIVQSPKRACPAGSRRNSLGLCKHSL